MGNRSAILIIHAIIYILVQVLLLQNFALFNTAFPFLYIAFLLMLPLDWGHLLLMIVGFVFGVAIDIFYNTLGIHAAACVLLTFLRPYWVSNITPSGGYENVKMPGLKTLGLDWFVVYTFPLIFVHHLALFFIEQGNLSMFFGTLWKVFLSSLFTFLVLVVTQYFFYAKERTA